MNGRKQEGTFNVMLARALRCQRFSWQGEREVVRAEQTGLLKDGESLRPDILIDAPNLAPVIIETEFDSAGNNPEIDAKNRLGKIVKTSDQVIQTAIALKMPEGIKRQTEETTEAGLIDGSIKIKYACLYNKEAKKGDKYFCERWPTKGWLEGTVADLADIVENSTPPGVVNELSQEVADDIKTIAEALHFIASPKTRAMIGERLRQDDSKSSMSVAVCIWINALIFQEQIAKQKTGDNAPLLLDAMMRKIETSKNTTSQNCLREEWDKILEDNYASIFNPAKDCLAGSFPSAEFREQLKRMVGLADRILSSRLIPLVDISAAVFPLVSVDRKEAAAFYTRPEAAELLACLALPYSCKMKEEWQDQQHLLAMHILDPACGTGTLLRAAYRRIRALHERAGGDTSERSLHAGFMTKVLSGIDISPIAAHLTAASLSGIQTLYPYKRTNITMAQVSGGKTGSLELLEKDELADLFGEIVSASHGEASTNDVGDRSIVLAGSQDLVIMNPPYSRTRGGQGLFDLAELSEEEQKDSQKRLESLLRGTPANKKAGLATAFILLAHRKLKKGGILASVLPISAASQKSWQGIRKMLEENYQEIVVITIVGQDSFSADTGMGEMLLLARKKTEREQQSSRLMVSLENFPIHLADASEIAKSINNIIDKSDKNQGILTITSDHARIGSWTRHPVTDNGNPNGTPWSEAGVENAGLAITTNKLKIGILTNTHGEEKQTLPLPITTLGRLFSIGPTHHLIGHPVGKEPIGAFEMHELPKRRVPNNPSLWVTLPEEQRTMLVSPTHEGVQAGTDEEIKKMQKAKSNLFISKQMRWTSQSLLVARTNRQAMGGNAWAALLGQKEVKDAFTFWANSTLGMMLYWSEGGKQHLGRSLIKMKGLADLPVPNFAEDSKAGEMARKVASEHFPCKDELQRACLSWQDSARQAIDDIVCEMFNFSADFRTDLAEIRKAWCSEPSVHGNNKIALQILSSSE